MPPQSTPVSVPSFTPLTHDVHTLPSHCPLTQSSAELHAEPLGHPSQSGPPQSAAVSFPSSTLLLHEVHTDPRHCPLPQSLSSPQTAPSEHSMPATWQSYPPQSTPVSVLSLTPFVHVSSGVSVRHTLSTTLDLT